MLVTSATPGSRSEPAAVSTAYSRVEREDDGGADEEEEVGKDEIGKGEAVPFGVVELRVGVGPVAGIVDQNHEGDGDASQDIYGQDTTGGRCGGNGPGHR